MKYYYGSKKFVYQVSIVESTKGYCPCLNKLV